MTPLEQLRQAVAVYLAQPFEPPWAMPEKKRTPAWRQQLAVRAACIGVKQVLEQQEKEKTHG